MNIGNRFHGVSAIGRGNILRRKKWRVAARAAFSSFLSFWIDLIIYAVSLIVLCGFFLVIGLPIIMLKLAEQSFRNIFEVSRATSPQLDTIKKR